MSDYLWDKNGEPDPDVERIEQVLRVFAQTAPPPPLDLRRLPAARAGFGRGALLIAATLALAVAGAVLTLYERRATPTWQVTTTSGRPMLST